MSNHSNDDPSFNDGIDHQKKIEGYPKPSEGGLPGPIKWIGYVLFGSIALMMLFALIGNFIWN